MTAPGLYVHVPFCRSRCAYCDFCSSTRGGEAERWLDALELEGESAAGQWGGFDTLYVGGGTPSILTADQLGTLFRILREHFTFTPGAEVTLEANPADLDLETASLLASLGVNRVSLGGQSFDRRVLAFLGRRHRAADVPRSVEALRSGGIERLSIDLILSVPGQSVEQWLETLRRAFLLEPDHFSCYQLTIEKGTPLGRRVERGEVAAVDEETARAHFLAGAEFLESQGYQQYEVSNFARGNRQRSRHNMKYWRHVPYLGLGPSAHSFDGESRWWNHDTLDSYLERLETGGSAEAGRERLAPDQLEMERIALGLRLSDGFEQGALTGEPERAAKLKRFQSMGLLTLSDGLVKPTRQGLLMADGLAREFCI